MKKIFPAIILFFIALGSKSQELGQISFSAGSNLSYISFISNVDVLIRVSVDGKILEWGTEVQSIRNNDYYAPRLQPYMGRVEYYGQEADSAFRGKVKSIGTTAITYYGSYDTDDKKGKIRSLGTQVFDYFTQYDDKVIRGKIRYAGNIAFQYYTSFDDEALRGKLRSAGNTGITYYSSFDDKFIRGKIKSIGPASYTWYTSLDVGKGSGLKSGSYRQNIGGVIYILQ